MTPQKSNINIDKLETASNWRAIAVSQMTSFVLPFHLTYFICIGWNVYMSKFA